MNEQITDDLQKVFRPVAWKDQDDTPKFSQLVEAAKNTFVQELRDFFDQKRAEGFLAEVPTIEKYAAPQVRTDQDDPYETAVNLIRAFPDIEQQLPLVAVTTASGAERKPSFTGNFVAHTQYPCRIRGTKGGPYTGLFSGNVTETLSIETEDKLGNPRISTWTFTRTMFADDTSITVEEMAAAINSQVLFAEANVVRDKLDTPNEEDVLELAVGGPKGHIRPNHITVLGSSSAAMLTALGLTVGQTDNSDNPERPAMNRYMVSVELTVGFDVGAESDNVRTELTDLMLNFGTLHFDRRNWVLYGRGVFDERFVLEHMQIIIKSSFGMSGEADIPRPDGDQMDKIYVNRFTMPVTVNFYVDRKIQPVVPSVPTYIDVTHSAEALNVPLRS